MDQTIDLASKAISTASGEKLQVFAKSSTGKGGDSVRMWEDVVEAGLKSGMRVQA